MRILRFDWSVRVVKNSVRCMYLTKFFELPVCWCMRYSSEEFNHNKDTTSQICITRAGACIIQILQELELEPALLKIKRTGRASN